MPYGTENHSQLLDGPTVPSVKAPPPRRRRYRLTSAGAIRKELAGLYGRLMDGDVTPETAKAGGFLLRCVLESLRLDEVEQRLSALESRQ